jgi:hypothetical protein
MDYCMRIVLIHIDEIYQLYIIYRSGSLSIRFTKINHKFLHWQMFFTKKIYGVFNSHSPSFALSIWLLFLLFVRMIKQALWSKRFQKKVQKPRHQPLW